MTNFDRAIVASKVKIKVLAEACGVSRQSIYMARKIGPSMAVAIAAAPVLGVPWHTLIDEPTVEEPVREREDGATEPQG